MTDSARIGSQELSGTPPHRRMAPQPPVISQHMEICQLHSAMRQREQLAEAVFQVARERRGISFRAVDAYRQTFLLEHPVRGRRLPRPISSGQIHGQIIYDMHHLLSKLSAHDSNGEDVLR